MAGCGEACSHVGAVLFALRYINQKQKSISCTSKINAWLPPRLKEVECTEIRNEDFRSVKKKYLSCILQSSEECNKAEKKIKTYAQTTDDERLKFFKMAQEKNIDCSVMAYIKETSHKYSTETSQSQTKNKINKSHVLSSLYNKNFTNFSLEELRNESVTVFENLKISESDAYSIERLTTKQSNSDLWYEQRAGRITASNMRSALHTSIKDPSLSLIKKICYPKDSNFFSDYTEHGKKYEKTARNHYIKKVTNEHDQFFFQEAGFLIDHVHPFIGASPDGMISCKCHGMGLLEIKCPTGENIESSCGLQNGSLSNDHDYFYQIQTQLLVWKLKYCDFVVWKSEKNFIVKRIFADENLQQKIVDGATNFFKKVLLPELLARFYSSLKNTPLGELNFEPKLICSCQKPAAHPIIKCELEQCAVKYFHWECVGVKGKRKIWFCSQCVICSCQKPAASYKVIKCENEQCTIKYFHCKCVGVKGKCKIWFCPQCNKKKPLITKN